MTYKVTKTQTLVRFMVLPDIDMWVTVHIEDHISVYREKYMDRICSIIRVIIILITSLRNPYSGSCICINCYLT